MGPSVWHRAIAITACLLLASGACSGNDGERADELGVDPSSPHYARAKAHFAAAQAARDGAQLFEREVSASAADPIGATMTSLRERAGITAVERSVDQASIVATTTDSLVFSILTDQKDRAEWTLAAATATRGTRPADARLSPLADGTDDDAIICDPSNYPRSKNACIVSAFDAEFGFDASAVKTPLSRAGYTVRSLTLKTPADIVKLRAALPSCGVIYVSSHGNVASTNLAKTRGNNVTTEIELDPKAFGENFIDMVEVLGADLESHVGVTAHRGKAYWSLTPAFFAQFRYPNSFVFVDACHSAQSHDGTSLAKAFRDNGAGAFVGWEGAISTKFSIPAVKAIFEGLAPKVAAVSAVKITTTPADPGARESYVPRVTVTPATAGVKVRLSISGTDGFKRTELRETDASGVVVFSTVPGGAGGVVDTLSTVVGGADNSATVLGVVKSDPKLGEVWKLPYNPLVDGRLSSLAQSATKGFNLICNNLTLTETTTIVKF